MDRRAWTLLILLAALWGASYLFIKVALEDLSPGVIVFARLALAALVLVPLAVRQRVLGALRPVLGPVVLLAVVQVAAPFLLITGGERSVPSGLTGVLIASSPLFTALLALRFAHGERSTGWRLAGLLVGIAGVAVLFGAELSGDLETAIGGLMILVASALYSVGALYLKARFAGVPPTAVVAGSMSAAALLTLPLAVAAPPAALPSAETIASVLLLGLGGTGVAFLLFYGLIAEVGAARASVVAYIAPAFSVAYGALLLAEPVTPGTVAGLGLVLAGSALAAGRAAPSARVSAAQPAPAPAPAR